MPNDFYGILFHLRAGLGIRYYGLVKPLPSREDITKIRLDLCPVPREEDEEDSSAAEAKQKRKSKSRSKSRTRHR